MSRIDELLTSFKRHVALPLRSGLPLSQRVWFIVYPPDDERRLAPRLPEFEMATKDAGLGWQRIDLSGAFAEWLDSFEDEEERKTCLGDPDLIETYASDGFLDLLKGRVEESVRESDAEQAERTVFALTGLMELYDFVHVSDVIETLDKEFPGILVVFFPGEREGNTYRFLGARDGWNYLAVPILPEVCP